MWNRRGGYFLLSIYFCKDPAEAAAGNPEECHAEQDRPKVSVLHGYIDEVKWFWLVFII